MAENIISLASFILTLMVFSYLLGDLPFIGSLYRAAVYIFIGMSAAFTLIVSYEGIILPYLQDIQNTGTSWTSLGNSADVVIFITGLLFALLLLLKPISALSWLSNSVLAVVIVVGAAAGVLGALTGTLIPLLAATVNLPADLSADLGATLDGLLIFIGTLSGLYYFHYQTRRGEDGEEEQSRLGLGFRQLGKFFLVCALGAIYASALLSSLTILTGRIAFLFQFGA